MVSRSHAPQSVGLLWTSDQSVAETSTGQHTILTTDKHPFPGGIRTHNLSRRAAVDLRLRPRGHWDRPLGIVLASKYVVREDICSFSWSACFVHHISSVQRVIFFFSLSLGIINRHFCNCESCFFLQVAVRLFKHCFKQLASFVNIIIFMPSEETEVVFGINVTAACFCLSFLPLLLYVRVSVFLSFPFGSSPFDARRFAKKSM